MFHHGLSWHPPPCSAQPVWAKFSTSTYIQATNTTNTCHICHLNYQRTHLTLYILSPSSAQHFWAKLSTSTYIQAATLLLTHRREHQQLQILLNFFLSVRASDNSDISHFSNVQRHICHKCTHFLGQVFNIYIHPTYIHNDDKINKF